MKKRREGVPAEDKIGWYYRHWKGMGLDKKTTKTQSLGNWNEQCENDPLFQKKDKKKPNTADLKKVDSLEE